MNPWLNDLSAHHFVPCFLGFGIQSSSSLPVKRLAPVGLELIMMAVKKANLPKNPFDPNLVITMTNMALQNGICIEFDETVGWW